MRTQIPGILYHNNGDGTFTDVTTQSGAINVAGALGVTWEDYDNDGYLDLYIVNTQPTTDPIGFFGTMEMALLLTSLLKPG